MHDKLKLDLVGFFSRPDAGAAAGLVQGANQG